MPEAAAASVVVLMGDDGYLYGIFDQAHEADAYANRDARQCALEGGGEDVPEHESATWEDVNLRWITTLSDLHPHCWTKQAQHRDGSVVANFFFEVIDVPVTHPGPWLSVTEKSE